MKREIKFFEIESKKLANPLLIYPESHLTQAFFYGEWQKNFGRKVRRFVGAQNLKPIIYFQIIKYPLPFGKNCLYIPYGPVLGVELDKNLLTKLKEQLKKIISEEKAVFIRLDFSPLQFRETNINLLKKFFHKSSIYTYRSAYFQPRFEWVLNLRHPVQTLLSNMHYKTRYNIKLAKRKGVKIEIISKNLTNYFDIFYYLIKETSKRKKFTLHPKIYYQTIFQNSLKNQNAFLSLASYKKKFLVANFVVLFGETAYFLYGGSIKEHKNLMPSYLTHWQSILYLKEKGYSKYNFGGISTEETKKVYKKMGMEKVTIFKKKFGGSLLKHSDFYDIIGNSFWYYFYNLGKFFKNL